MGKVGNKVLTLSWIIALITLLALIATLNKFGVITGQATDTGEANLTIQAQASISFTTSQINFGTGFVNEDASYGNLTTEGDLTNTTSFTNVTQGLVLSNDGNVNVTVNLTSQKIASAFIGGVAGPGPLFAWKASENEANSCEGGIQNIASYTEVTAASVRICDDLLYTADNDTLLIDLSIVVPEDALGTKGNVITAEGLAL